MGGQVCNDMKFPILDYEEAEQRCLCRAHPCWDDDGVRHVCEDPQYQHLKYHYDDDGKLICECSSEPHYATLYISKEKCQGQTCSDSEHPILDFDEEKGECVCRSHPCWGLMDGDEQVKHECMDPEFPILHYREDPEEDGTTKEICECKAALRESHDEL